LPRPGRLLGLLCLAVLFQVTVFGLAPSTVSLTASPNTSNYGQPVSLTATVTAGASGKVTFYDGVTMLGVSAVTNGQAKWSTVMLASGKRSLHAHYSGDTAYAPSNSPNMPQTVVAAPSLGFHKPVTNNSIYEISSIAVGDFDGDGKQDLALTAPNTVTVFLGNGDGTFAKGVSYSLPYTPGTIAAGDFNGDGKTDLVVTFPYYLSIAVLLGNGDGTFTSAVKYPSAVAGGTIVVADFNGDGIADLAINGNSTQNIAVLLGNGDGSFQTAVTYPIGAQVESIAVGDFNGDTIPDIATADNSGIGILIGKGDGTFASAVSYATTYQPYSIAAGDLDGNGTTDLVAGNYNGIYVLLGNGDGTFQTAVSYTLASPGFVTMMADFNGDGIPDIAVGANYSGLYLLLGSGNGSFQSPIALLSSAELDALAVGDFNGDGKTDLVAGLNYSNGFDILLGGATPDLSIAVSHDGGLTEDQQGASYTITVSNVGEVATSGPVGVVVNLAANLTGSGIAGTGWTCVPATLVCTRSDAISPGGSYPVITVRVNVAHVTGNITSTFTVSGGNDQSPANNTVSDTAFARYPR